MYNKIKFRVIAELSKKIQLTFLWTSEINFKVAREKEFKKIVTRRNRKNEKI